MKTKLPARTALAGSLALLLAACALPEPKPLEVSMRTIRSADYGPYPRNYERLIRNHLNQTLLDADSAKIRIINSPRRVFRVTDSVTEPNTSAFYLVCVNVNAKNAYGGYTGWQTKFYRFEHGAISTNGATSLEACESKNDIYIDTLIIYDRIKVVP